MLLERFSLPFFNLPTFPQHTHTRTHTWPCTQKVKNRVALEKLCEIAEVVINPDSQEIYGRDFSTDSKLFVCAKCDGMAIEMPSIAFGDARTHTGGSVRMLWFQSHMFRMEMHFHFCQLWDTRKQWANKSVHQVNG